MSRPLGLALEFFEIRGSGTTARGSPECLHQRPTLGHTSRRNSSQFAKNAAKCELEHRRLLACPRRAAFAFRSRTRVSPDDRSNDSHAAFVRSDSDDRSFQRLARSVAPQNTLNRHKASTPVSPILTHRVLAGLGRRERKRPDLAPRGLERLLLRRRPPVGHIGGACGCSSFYA